MKYLRKKQDKLICSFTRKTKKLNAWQFQDVSSQLSRATNHMWTCSKMNRKKEAESVHQWHCQRSRALLYLIKDSEGLSDLLLTVGVLHLSCHHCEELGEVNGSITWRRKTNKSTLHQRGVGFWSGAKLVPESSEMLTSPEKEKDMAPTPLATELTLWLEQRPAMENQLKLMLERRRLQSQILYRQSRLFSHSWAKSLTRTC